MLCKAPRNPSQGRDGGGINHVKFQGKCNHCGKYGHKEYQCWAKHGRPNKTEDQGNQAVEDVNDEDEEMVLMAWSSGINEDQ